MDLCSLLWGIFNSLWNHMVPSWRHVALGSLLAPLLLNFITSRHAFSGVVAYFSGWWHIKESPLSASPSRIRYWRRSVMKRVAGGSVLLALFSATSGLWRVQAHPIRWQETYNHKSVFPHRQTQYKWSMHVIRLFIFFIISFSLFYSCECRFWRPELADYACACVALWAGSIKL